MKSTFYASALLTGLFMTAVFCSSVSAEIYIDDFSSDFDLPGTGNVLNVIGTTGASNSTSQTTVAGTIGTGTRTATVEVSGHTGVGGEVQMTIIGVAGLNVPSVGSNAAGTWSLAYNSFVGTYVDVERFGHIEMTYFSNPGNYLNLILTLEDDDSFDTFELNLLPPAVSGAVAVWDFSEFSGIDFTQIKSVSLVAEGVNAAGDPDIQGDYLFTEFKAIPEPASLLLVLGGVALMTSRRRK